MPGLPPGTPAQRLTIMLHATEHAHHHSLAVELLARAKRAHLAGATLLEAVEGRGRSGMLHRQHLFGEDTPLSLLIVDEKDKIAAFLDQNHDALAHTVIILDDVTAFRGPPRPPCS